MVIVSSSTRRPSIPSEQDERPCPSRQQPRYGAVMSIDGSLQRLADTLTQYHFAYLLTVGDDERAHVVAVHPTLANDTLLIGALGDKTSANLAAHPLVTVVWPPTDPSDYSLIVDGVGSMRDGRLAITPTRAVLHRPAPPQAMTGPDCKSDCIELLAGRAAGRNEDRVEESVAAQRLR